jgi:hypothetical protein
MSMVGVPPTIREGIGRRPVMEGVLQRTNSLLGLLAGLGSPA